VRPAPEAVCSSSDPRLKCAGRHDAGLRGEFQYSFDAHGWVWSILDGRVMLWTRCPWCKARLPDVGAEYQRLRHGIHEGE
jgi:hypothetical protein